MVTTREFLKQRTAFDPGDPFDAVSDMFRRQVSEIALGAIGQRPMTDLERHRQIEAMIAGVLTGLVGVCFAHIEAGGRPAVMKAIRAYLPQARVQAEEIMRAAAAVLNHPEGEVK